MNHSLEILDDRNTRTVWIGGFPVPMDKFLQIAGVMMFRNTGKYLLRLELSPSELERFSLYQRENSKPENGVEDFTYVFGT